MYLMIYENKNGKGWKKAIDENALIEYAQNNNIHIDEYGIINLNNLLTDDRMKYYKDIELVYRKVCEAIR